MADVIDVMVTLSHSVDDAHATELACWTCSVCSKNGLRLFYKPGLSGSSALEGRRRRFLRDAFELASCVAAVAVAVATQVEEPPQLASEIVWAAQHSKPMILLYDSSQPFDMQAWQESFPELFPSHVVRYYGKGHEECAADLARAIQSTGMSKATGAEQMISSTSRLEAGMGDVEDASQESLCFSEEAWQAALERMRAAQPADLPKVSFKGILRNRERWIKRHSAAAPFLEGEVQEAVRYIMKMLPAASEDAALELLCASVGVSERVVSASLRVLAARLPSLVQQLDFIQEVFAWSLAAVHRHVDSVDVCTFGTECLRISHGLMLSSGTAPMRICSTEAEHIVAAIRSFPSCHALQRNGFAVLLQLLRCPDSFRVQESGEAIALPGGGLARILTRECVAEMALKAIGPSDTELLHDVCQVLQILAASSRGVKESGAYLLHNMRPNRVLTVKLPDVCHVFHVCQCTARLLLGSAMKTWVRLLRCPAHVFGQFDVFMCSSMPGPAIRSPRRYFSCLVLGWLQASQHST